MLQVLWQRCSMGTDKSIKSSLWSLPSGSLILATSATTLVALVLVMLYVEAQQRKKLPPGPFPFLIVGNFPSLAGKLLPHRALTKLAAQYGGLMYLRLGSVPCIVVSTAAVAKELVQTNDANISSRPKGLAFEILSDNYQNLVVAPYGKHWRQLRKMCKLELFSPKRHASYQKVRTEEIDYMMRVLLDDSRKGHIVNLKSWLTGVAANNMTRMLVNKRYFGTGEGMRHDREEFEFMLTTGTKLAGAFILSDFVPYLRFMTKLQGWKPKLIEFYDLIRSISSKIAEIDHHKERAKGLDSQNHMTDFIDLLLTMLQDDGKPLSDHIIDMLVMDLMSAGVETGATSAEWAMTELMMKPDLVKRAQDELDTVVGRHRKVQESDIPNLPFIQAVVKESFRLHPAVPLGVPRESLNAFTCQGYNLPAKTRLIFNIFAIHRDPSVYKNPDKFDPNRFMDRPDVNALSGFDSYELSPFGVGRRMCPASTLGNVVVTMMLATLLHSFNWSLPEEDCPETLDMSEVFGLTVAKMKPLSLTAKPRSPAFLYT